MSKAPSPFAISQAMLAARSFAERLREEIGEDDHDRLLISLDSETDAIGLLRRVALSALEDEANAEAARARAKNLTVRAKRFEERANAARSLIFSMLDALGLQKLDDPEFSVSIRAGNPKPVVTDESALPDYCVRIKREPDMAALREHLEVGPVPGAEMSNGFPSVTIRSR